MARRIFVTEAGRRMIRAVLAEVWGECAWTDRAAFEEEVAFSVEFGVLVGEPYSEWVIAR